MSFHAVGPGAREAADQDEVARFLVDLRALGEVEPPTPSPELAALLGGATLLPPRRHPYRIAARSALVAAALVTGLVVAAEKHSLPQPAQRVVSDVVDVLTPFEIAPGDAVTPTPTPTPTPTHRRRPVVAPGDESTAPGGDDRSGGSDDGSGSGSDDGSGSGSDDGIGSGPDDGIGSVGGSDDGASTAPRTGSTGGDAGERESGSDD